MFYSLIRTSKREFLYPYSGGFWARKLIGNVKTEILRCWGRNWVIWGKRESWAFQVGSNRDEIAEIGEEQTGRETDSLMDC
jgi:hypothetical protein